MSCLPLFSFFFFFNDTATTEIYTLSLHDALPIYPIDHLQQVFVVLEAHIGRLELAVALHVHLLVGVDERSEEHTSELQSQSNLVCRLLLEKKNKNKYA